MAGWRAVEIPGSYAPLTIVEHDGRLIALGSPGQDRPETVMAISDDGQVWTTMDPSRIGPGFGGIFSGKPDFGATAAQYVPGEVAVPTYLFSPDGETWETAVPPADCVSAMPPVFGEFGFVTLGSLCRLDAEVPGPPGPLYVLTSVDGRAWTSRLDDERLAGIWATDGRRLVLLTNAGTLDPVSVWLSDDLGQSWRYVESPFPAGVSIYDVKWGHDRYVTRGSWLSRDGDPDSASCVSADGETWDCAVITASADLPDRSFLGEQLGVTSTGFVSLVPYVDDPFAQSSAYSMVMATSSDGLKWTFTLLPEMANLLPSAIVSTSHGLFTWGGTNPITDPSGRSQPYLQVYRAPLP